MFFEIAINVTYFTINITVGWVKVGQKLLLTILINN